MVAPPPSITRWRRPFIGRGLVTQCCAALIRFAFEEWNLHRLEIWVDVVNVKSCAIPERLGFVKEGVLRELARYGDYYGDVAVYALLKNDWQAGGSPA